MLSYRHSFHAGNFADVIKHIVIIEILDYLIQKDKAFEYVDTHAGAGLFDLKSGHATKLNEYVNGIAKLKAKDWPELSRYFEVIKTYNSANTLSYYPGSPLIAMHFLRPQDRAWFFELHRHDYDLLTNNTGSNKRIKTMHKDGFTGL
ncbi:MAG: 23S rRNA (adenine(2030)-N(6))-methyltransferase RlmJ, partial [Gammaproteobacteria bacterium]|nr:23S rRNA (adenine(2030)-N(6))-methyltransferase RlmJ [Gammaproteobacteria bacterium]